MKRTHRADVRCWSRFDEARDMDFNAWAWLRPGGSVLIDPLPLGDHDRAELEAAGPVTHVVVTNSDHTRAAAAIAARYGAQLCGPAAERGVFECDRWLSDGESIVQGLVAFALEGSKTPGELALLLEETTLFTGDLVRAPIGGMLAMLPDPKLTDRSRALASIERLLGNERIDAVLVGDGWPVFSDGRGKLRSLLANG